jgi:heat shock protein HslJ
MAGRIGVTFLAVVGLVVAACGGSSATPTPAPAVTDAPPAASVTPTSPAPVASARALASIEGVEWLLAEMSDGSEMAAIPPEIPVSLSMVDGIAVGFSGCNDYRGPYTITADEIVFGEMATTVKTCDDGAVLVESNYLQALSYVARFGVRETGLLFVSPPGAPLLAYAPKPTGDITERWVLTAMQNAQGAIVAPVAGTEVVTTFKDDGTLEGNDGCNDFTGAWATTGPRIAISSVGGTRAACPSQDLSDQEAQFLAMLQASTIWTASDRELTLRGTNGITTLVYTHTDAVDGAVDAAGSDAPASPAAASPAAS